jgi:hypothetical protein
MRLEELRDLHYLLGRAIAWSEYIERDMMLKVG